MKIFFWNIRGFGKASRRKQVKEYIMQENASIVGLQETIKQNLNFTWIWSAAKGHSGGLLVGLKTDCFEMEDHECQDNFVWVLIRDRNSNFRWNLVIAYGPAQHEYSEGFLQNLEVVCNKSPLPVVMGGDFNLVREANEKSNEQTNKQVNPIMVKLDRILVPVEWEQRYPLCLARILTRIGSDHTPLILDTGEQGLVPNFGELISSKWDELVQKRNEGLYSMDAWHGILCGIRRFLKGWNIRMIGEKNNDEYCRNVKKQK
ncbi:hypothetical protein BS78_04G197800 [Paspalum vaginatum]|nr:hypothetical protein BS78_04G197800 [Paspalum vaginatum]